MRTFYTYKIIKVGWSTRYPHLITYIVSILCLRLKRKRITHANIYILMQILIFAKKILHFSPQKKKSNEAMCWRIDTWAINQQRADSFRIEAKSFSGSFIMLMLTRRSYHASNIPTLNSLLADLNGGSRRAFIIFKFLLAFPLCRSVSHPVFITPFLLLSCSNIYVHLIIRLFRLRE